MNVIRRFGHGAVLAALLLCGIDGIAYGEGTGTVLSAGGAGAIHRHGAALALQPGTGLLPEDSITTGSDGSATIVLPSGEAIRLGPNSTFTISRTPARENLLSLLWSSVRAKFSAGDETHAALGTLGAVRAAPEAPVLEDFPYPGGDGADHRERRTEIESLFAAGTITDSDAALLAAIIAEEYGQFASAFQSYRSVLSPAGRLLLTGKAPQDMSPSEWDRSIAVLIADLYITNGYYEAAAALAEGFSLR